MVVCCSKSWFSVWLCVSCTRKHVFHWTAKRNCCSEGHRGCWADWVNLFHKQNYGHVQYPTCLGKGTPKGLSSGSRALCSSNALGTEAEVSVKTVLYKGVLPSFLENILSKNTTENVSKSSFTSSVLSAATSPVCQSCKTFNLHSATAELIFFPPRSKSQKQHFLVLSCVLASVICYYAVERCHTRTIKKFLHR